MKGKTYGNERGHHADPAPGSAVNTIYTVMITQTQNTDLAKIMLGRLKFDLRVLKLKIHSRK